MKLMIAALTACVYVTAGCGKQHSNDTNGAAPMATPSGVTNEPASSKLNAPPQAPSPLSQPDVRPAKESLSLSQTKEIDVPASSGDQAKVLDALRGGAAEFAGYTVSEVKQQLQLRELSFALLNDFKSYQTIYRYGVGHRASLDANGQAQISAIINDVVDAKINSECKLTNESQFRLVVNLYSDNSTVFDANQNPSMPMYVWLCLLDTTKKQVLWYTDKASSLGGSPFDAATNAANNIATQVDNLFKTK